MNTQKNDRLLSFLTEKFKFHKQRLVQTGGNRVFQTLTGAINNRSACFK